MTSTTVRVQVATFVALTAVMLAATAQIEGVSPGVFDDYLAGFDPLAAVAICGVAGLGLLAGLSRREQFALFNRQCLRTWPAILAGTLPFAVAAIALDVLVTFPKDTNVAWPDALLFYPVIAFVVEIVFHLLPLVVVLRLVERVRRSTHRAWIAFLIVATLEPAYQAMFVIVDGGYPAWSVISLCVYLYAFNLVQLWIFRHYDFMTMYLFRLGYYAIWHVGWGHVRLTLLW